MQQAELIRYAVHQASASLGTAARLTLVEAPARDLNCPETLILHREKLGYLHDAIAALPERLQFVVMARFFRQQSMRAIAVELSISESRVSQLCTEALALIRDGMNSQLDPDALRSMAQFGPPGRARTAYYKALADGSTVAGRLNMSTPHGEMRSGTVESSQRYAS